MSDTQVVSKKRSHSRRRSPPAEAPSAGPEIFAAPFDRSDSVGQRIDATVGRSASDFIQVPPPGDAGTPAVAADAKPVVWSQFAAELRDRIEVARQRVSEEVVHLDAVERVATDYRPGERPWLRLVR